MRIVNPQREAETIWLFENPFNRVDIESAVFQHQNMEYLTGEYEAYLYDGDKPGLKNIKFTAKFIYTKGDPRLMLSTEQMDVKSEEDLLKIISKINLKKLKLYFPMIKTINESEKHKTIYTFK